MKAVVLLAILALAVVVRAAETETETEAETDAELDRKGKRKTATRSVAGNATIPAVPQFVTRFALAPSARCSASRRLVPSALSTASSPNVAFAARRTCARRIRARSARRFALRPSATRRALPRRLNARRCAKRRPARGRALSRRRARDPNASSNAANRPAMLRTNRDAASAMARVRALRRSTPRAMSRRTCNPLSPRSSRTSSTRRRMVLRNAARAARRANKQPSGPAMRAQAQARAVAVGSIRCRWCSHCAVHPSVTSSPSPPCRTARVPAVASALQSLTLAQSEAVI